MRRTLLLAAMVVAISAAAEAASPATEAFVSNTRLAVGFLNETSALAIDRSDDETLRALADAELRAQPQVLAVLDRRTLPGAAPSQAVALIDDGLQTGRSVAMEPTISTGAFASPIGTGATMPAALITIDRLTASKGRAFDVLYATAQLAVLADLKAAYDVYGHTGDDPALQQVARNETVVIAERIATLKHVQARAD